MDVLDRADVEAARRLCGDQDVRVARHLAGDDDLLLVAARKRAAGSLRAPATNVEVLDQLCRALEQSLRIEPARLRGRRVAVVVQRDVLRDRELEHEAAALPVFRDVPHAGVQHFPRGRIVRRVLPGDHDPSTGQPPQARERVDQLGLAVPVHAGDRENLAGADVERDAAHLLEAAIVEDLEIVDLEERVARRRGRLVHAEQHLTPDHHPREALLGRALRGHGVDRLAAPEHRDPVGDLEHLVELVRDEDDRLPLRLQLGDDREELPRLLRCEDRGRLVQHEDLRPAVERLQDLDALLLRDRDVLDQRVGIDCEAVAVGKLADALPRLADVEHHARVGRLLGEDDVLRHRHHRDQHEVLVDHADPASRSRPWRRRTRSSCPSGGSRRRPGGTARTGCSSASTCRRRSRRAGHAPRPRGGRSSTLSLASTPGNCLVIPMSARTVSFGHERRFCHARGRASRPALRSAIRSGP